MCALRSLPDDVALTARLLCSARDTASMRAARRSPGASASSVPSLHARQSDCSDIGKSQSPPGPGVTSALLGQGLSTQSSCCAPSSSLIACQAPEQPAGSAEVFSALQGGAQKLQQAPRLHFLRRFFGRKKHTVAAHEVEAGAHDGVEGQPKKPTCQSEASTARVSPCPAKVQPRTCATPDDEQGCLDRIEPSSPVPSVQKFSKVRIVALQSKYARVLTLRICDRTRPRALAIQVALGLPRPTRTTSATFALKPT
jgi:hypothetical protein